MAFPSQSAMLLVPSGSLCFRLPTRSTSRPLTKTSSSVALPAMVAVVSTRDGASSVRHSIFCSGARLV